MTIDHLGEALGNLSEFIELPDGANRLRALVLRAAFEGRLTLTGEDDTSRLSAPALGPRDNDWARGSTIPSSWSWRRLHDLVDLINGDRGKNYPNKNDRQDSGIPFVNAGHLRYGQIDHSQMDYISPERFALLRSGKFKANDVIYCLRGSLGKTAVVREGETGAIASSLIILRPSASLLPRFLYFYLISPLGRELIRQFDNGSAQPNLSGRSVGRYVIPFPSEEEQAAVVTFLERIFLLIDGVALRVQEREQSRQRLTESALRSLAHTTDWIALDWLPEMITTPQDVQHLREAIIELAVAGKLCRQDSDNHVTLENTFFRNPESLDPPDLVDAKGRMVPDPYPLPAGWRWVALGSVLTDIRAGWSPRSLERPKVDDEWAVLKVSACSWGEFRPSENKALSSELVPRPELEVLRGDFLISRANTSELVGRSVIVDETLPRLMLSDKTLRLTVVDECSPRFLNLANLSRTAREHYKREATGTSSSMLNISQRVIRRTPIPLPSAAEQDRIIERVNELMCLLRRLHRELSD